MQYPYLTQLREVSKASWRRWCRQDPWSWRMRKNQRGGGSAEEGTQKHMETTYIWRTSFFPMSLSILVKINISCGNRHIRKIVVVYHNSKYFPCLCKVQMMGPGHRGSYRDLAGFNTWLPKSASVLISSQQMGKTVEDCMKVSPGPGLDVVCITSACILLASSLSHGPT